MPTPIAEDVASWTWPEDVVRRLEARGEPVPRREEGYPSAVAMVQAGSIRAEEMAVGRIHAGAMRWGMVVGQGGEVICPTRTWEAFRERVQDILPLPAKDRPALHTPTGRKVIVSQAWNRVEVLLFRDMSQPKTGPDINVLALPYHDGELVAVVADRIVAAVMGAAPEENDR